MLPDTITEFHVLAPLAALVGGVLTYYVLGRHLGAGDDFWSPVRHRVLPLLERVLQATLGRGYATGTQQENRFAARVIADPDAVEIALEDAGADKGPIAAAKTHPDHGESYASWHYRRLERPALRRVFDVLEVLPLASRLLLTVERMLALRQIHVRLYVTENGNTDVYADEEWNAINPFTAFWHYRGKTRTVLGETLPPHRPKEGREWLLDVLRRHECSYVTEPDRDD